MEKCKALVWEYSRLQSVLTEHPQIRKNINQILSNRLQELEERFREIATERVAKRLALTLLRLMRQVGREQNGGTQISLSRAVFSHPVETARNTPAATPTEVTTSLNRCRPSACSAGDRKRRPADSSTNDQAPLIAVATAFKAMPWNGACNTWG